jgi:hypothetical protein
MWELAQATKINDSSCPVNQINDVWIRQGKLNSGKFMNLGIRRGNQNQWFCNPCHTKWWIWELARAHKIYDRACPGMQNQDLRYRQEKEKYDFACPGMQNHW